MSNQNWRPVRPNNQPGNQYQVRQYEPNNQSERRTEVRTRNGKRNRSNGLGINYNYLLLGLGVAILYAFWYLTENEKASAAGYVLIGMGGLLVVLVVCFAIFMTLAKHISSLEAYRLKLFISERKNEQSFDRAVERQANQMTRVIVRAAMAHNHAKSRQLSDAQNVLPGNTPEQPISLRIDQIEDAEAEIEY